MKRIMILLLHSLVILPCLQVEADVLTSEDDTYVGLQVSIPLGQGRKYHASTATEYSFLIVNRSNGISDGVVWRHYDSGKQTLGLLRPSSTFLLGESRISDYTLPFLSSDAGINNLTTLDGKDFLIYTVGGIYIIAHAIGDALDSMDEHDPDDLVDDEAEDDGTDLKKVDDH